MQENHVRGWVEVVVLLWWKMKGFRRLPYIGRRGKTPWGKPGSAINPMRKSQAASCWGPWKKFHPFTTYDTFPPHNYVQTWVPGQWIGKSCAVPGRTITVGQRSPGITQILLSLLECIENGKILYQILRKRIIGNLYQLQFFIVVSGLYRILFS